MLAAIARYLRGHCGDPVTPRVASVRLWGACEALGGLQGDRKDLARGPDLSTVLVMLVLKWRHTCYSLEPWWVA
jgi:hypothetical protein